MTATGCIVASKVGLLFLKFEAESTRIRLTGSAKIDEDAAAIASLPGAKRLIRVTADYIYYNCPRYIPEMEMVTPSAHGPRPDYTPPEPEWKSRDYIKDVLD